MIDRRFIWIFGVPSLVVSLILLPPIAQILIVAYNRGASLSRMLSQEVINAAVNSVKAASITTAFVVLFGLPLAYLLARVDFPGKSLAISLITMPLVIPPVVGGILLLSLYGPQGVIGGIAEMANVHLTNSVLGIAIAQMFVTSPYLILVAKSAFEEIDPNLERASLMLGEGALKTFFRVSLPLSKRGILAGLALTFARSIGEFGATVVLSYYPRSLPVQIWIDFTGEGLRASLPGVLVLTGFAVAMVLLTFVLRGRNFMFPFLPRERPE